ncbi:MAG: UDP-N-acetylmuramate dehydrogenase [Bacteriovoracia bacterium]
MSLREKLEHISGIELKWDADLTSYSTFRLKSRGDIVHVASERALAEVLKEVRASGRPWRIVGWGANQVFRTNESDLLIYLDFPQTLEELASYRDEYSLSASTGLNHLTGAASKHGLKGWEALTGIPASLGGAIYMNAGTALGEIGSLVKSVRLMNEAGEIRTEVITKASFSYRKNHFVMPGEVIISAVIGHQGQDADVPAKIKAYLEYRRSSQPLATKNCGCVFKNQSPQKQAGRLIDLTGLKGVTVGALRVSHKHANFMENVGDASAEDFRTIVDLVNLEMRLYWGVEFELEVKAV